MIKPKKSNSKVVKPTKPKKVNSQQLLTNLDNLDVAKQLTALVQIEPKLDNSENISDITIPKQITTQAQYIALAHVLKEVLYPLRDTVVAYFKDTKALWNKGHKKECQRERDQLQPIDAKIKPIVSLLNDWDNEQKRLQQLAYEKAQQALLEAETEIKVSKAEQLIAKGDHEAADEVLAELDEIDVNESLPELRARPSLVKGVSHVESWSVELIDKDKITNRDCLQADMSTIRKLVNKQGPKAEKLVGVGSIRIYKDSSLRVRRR